MLTVIQPDPTVGLDRFATWLPTDYRIVLLSEQPVPSIDSCAGGILVLGGTMNANEGSDWLPTMRQLLRDAVTRNIPVFGICLGHQLLATAFGGEVTVGHAPSKEDGGAHITLTEDGQRDDVLKVLGARTFLPESHNDAVTRLPDGAVLLASSDACAVQAMRIGSAVSVQFHPEASPSTVHRWALESDFSAEEAQAMYQELEDADAEVSAAGQALAQAFVATLP